MTIKSVQFSSIQIEFQLCRVNPRQHKISWPPPSEKQDRTSGTLQSTDWEGEASARALSSVKGMRGCTSDVTIF